MKQACRGCDDQTAGIDLEGYCPRCAEEIGAEIVDPPSGGVAVVIFGLAAWLMFLLARFGS